MNLLPIVERELRLASQKSGTYWTRVWIGLLGILVLGSAIMTARFAPRGMFGLAAVFSFIRFFGVIYCLVTGVRLTSDCISQEKRDGTLGFLFLTDLRGYDVILGKLIAKGILPTYTMMAIVPLVWLVSLMGGVTGGELFYTVIALGNALFFSLAVGITVSTFFRDRRRCELVASATVFLLFFVVFPLVDHLIYALMTSTAGTWVVGASPVNFLTSRVNAVANPTASGLSGNLAGLVSNGVVHLTSWCLIAIASWWAPRCWQEKPPAGARLSIKQRWAQWCYGAPRARAVRRTAALDVNPFFWRATRNRLRPLVPWVFIIFTFGIPAAILLSTGFSPPGFYVFLVFTLVFWYLAPKIWIAREATRTLSSERAEGTLEMVLSTPLSIHEIIRGQWMGLRRCYMVAVIFPVVMSLTLIVMINFVPSARWLRDIPYATTFLISGTIMFLTDCVALGWVGMWCAVKTGNAKAAGRITSSRVISYPTVLIVLSLFILTVYSEAFAAMGWPRIPGGSPLANPRLVIGLWVFIGLACDIVVIKTSRALLYREFRTIVEEPALARDAWARALGRWVGGMWRGKRST